MGIKFVASPRHADLLLVTGPVSVNMEEALKRTYDAVPDPKLVIAIGDCGAAAESSERATQAEARLRMSSPCITRLEAVRQIPLRFCRPSCRQFSQSRSRNKLPLSKSRDSVGTPEVPLEEKNPISLIFLEVDKFIVRRMGQVIRTILIVREKFGQM